MTSRPESDGYMSCPCGRGDYRLCVKCLYPMCSVHGHSVSNISSTPGSPAGPPEAEPPVRPWRKFNVWGRDAECDSRDVEVSIRCWVCGTGRAFITGPRRDAVALEELNDWAAAHVCPRVAVPDDGKPADAPPGGFWHAHPEQED